MTNNIVKARKKNNNIKPTPINDFKGTKRIDPNIVKGQNKIRESAIDLKNQKTSIDLSGLSWCRIFSLDCRFIILNNWGSLYLNFFIN